ncbi:MAG: hypothetical protein ACR2QI_03035 [Woeseiaceae bacterium]
MNKIITVALIAGGLLLLDSPEAAAHKEVRNMYQPWAHSPSAYYPSAQYRVESRRVKHMPRWLKRNKSFRHWYKHTRLRHNRYIAWRQLFDIYRWERTYAGNYRRADRNYNYYSNNRDRNRGDRRSHRH